MVLKDNMIDGMPIWKEWVSDRCMVIQGVTFVSEPVWDTMGGTYKKRFEEICMLWFSEDNQRGLEKLFRKDERLSILVHYPNKPFFNGCFFTPYRLEVRGYRGIPITAYGPDKGDPKVRETLKRYDDWRKKQAS